MRTVVFGGSRGIGAAIVRALAQDGGDVGYTYVNAPASVLAGGSVTSYQADIRSADDVARVFVSAARNLGGAPECVIANAGINVLPAPMAQVDPENFRKLVELNIVGAFNVLQSAAQQVPDGGSIIALTTLMVRQAVPGAGPYSATKAAVECLVRSMAKELGPRGVRVNAVAPGAVETDLFRNGKDEASVQRSAAMSPFNRIGTPDEIAEVVRFLASPTSSWVHEQVIQPNGGMI